MKKNNQLFAKIAMFALFVGVAIFFTSCEKEEDYPIFNYTMGWSTFSSSSITSFGEMAAVEDAFQNAFDISSSSFTVQGTSVNCDIMVVALCKEAEASLAGTTFSDSTKGTYTVTNSTNAEVVYIYTIE